MRIGYVTGRYPAVSHTFVLREARAMRELGVDVATFSVFRSTAADLLSDDDRVEFGRTRALWPVGVAELAGAHAVALLLAPRRYASALRVALDLSAGGPRGVARQLRYFATAIVLWRVCRRQGICHLHAHIANAAADVAMLAAHFGGPSWRWSLTLHGAPKSTAQAVTLPAKVARADVVVCVSDFLRSQVMVSVHESHWPRLEVVHCGVDTATFARRRDALRGGGRRDGEGVPVRILTVGRLIPLKGHRLLLDALVSLESDHGIRATVVVVGEGPSRAALETHARALGVADRVRFAGAVGQDQIREHYAAADVFCLPSLQEGIPVVLMEAMAMEIPVVATRITGIPELVEHGTSGLLVTPGRADVLAEALASLAADAPRRAAMGAAGRARVQEDFELAGCARKLRKRLAATAVA